MSAFTYVGHEIQGHQRVEVGVGRAMAKFNFSRD